MAFTYLDHTADMGFLVQAADLPTLMAEAARALFSTIVDLSQITPSEERRFEVEGSDLESLLVHWLKKLLYLYETEGWLPGAFDVRVHDGQLIALVRGEAVEAHHEILGQVKAVTYHGLQVEPCEGGWCARVICDV